MQTASNKGFTLIEILVVLAIMGILVSLTFTTFVSYRKSEALSKDTELVVATLQQARSQTIASKNALAYGVHFATSSITLFPGNSYDPSNAGNVTQALSPGIALSTNLPDNASSIVFKRITGETDQFSPSAVVLANDVYATSTIRVYQTGIVEKVSP